MATHCSILAWKIPWTEESDRLQFKRSQRVGHDWAIERAHTHTHTQIHRAKIVFWINSSATQQVPGDVLIYSSKKTHLEQQMWMESPPGYIYDNPLLFSKNYLFSLQVKHVSCIGLWWKLPPSPHILQVLHDATNLCHTSRNSHWFY